MGNEYDYANARIRAMKSRLLTHADYVALLDDPTIDEMIAGLAESIYQPEIEAALVKSAGWECLSEALRRHLAGTVSRITRSFRDEPLRLWQMLIGRWEVFSLKTVLRGQAHHIPASEVMESLIPIGELREPDYSRLVQQATVRESVDLLVTWKHPYAHALAEAMPRYAERGDVAALDLALDRARYRSAFKELANLDDEGASLVRQVLKGEIDATNILALLRLSESGDRANLAHGNGSVTPSLFLIEGGGPASDRVLALREIPELGNLVRDLASTDYGEDLARGMAYYQEKKSMKAFQDEIDDRLTRRSIALFSHDPLSMGIGIAYLAALVNEARNLRMIGRGKIAGWKREEIEKELKFWQS